LILDEVENLGQSVIPAQDRDSEKIKLILNELGYDVRSNGNGKLIVTNTFNYKG
jgi:hypothetical protein